MERIKKEFKNYQNKLQTINAELNKLPDGILIVRNNRYYQRVDGKDIGITKNQTLIKQLVRKKYLSKVKKELEKNIKTLSAPMSRITTTKFEDAISDLNMPIENFYHSTIADWVAKPYRQNMFKPEDQKYETNGGMKVRSKSELIIANLLEEYKIPYRYEPEMTIKGKKICPDFVIRNPFTAELIVWEHFGALHKEDYEQSMNDKMERYSAQGLVPFETLIYTFEFDLNPKRLRNLIENIILR